MEVYFPRQRVPDGLAALEGLAHQMEPEAVEGSAELHREGACRRLRGSLSTGLATRELPPPRGTGSAGMRVNSAAYAGMADSCESTAP